MTFDLDVILEDCLERLTWGETTQACLARYPEQAAELKPLLEVAALLEKQSQMPPSTTFKARARAQLYTHMNAHPRTSRHWWNISLPFSSLAIGLAALLLAFTLTGTALAQSALPGTAFYSWKLVGEQASRVVSPDPLGVDLALAERRVDELIAVSGNATAQEIAIKEYRRIATNLEKYQGLAAQSRIRLALATQQERLRSAGILLMDAGTPTLTTTVVPPTRTQVSTRTIPPSPKPTLIPSKLVPTQIRLTIAPILPTVKLPTVVLPTTIKIPTALPTVIHIPTILPTKIKIPTLPIPIPTLALGLP